MSSIKIFPRKKTASAHNASLSETKIKTMAVKLEDPEYMDGAIYRLATIITDRILSGGWDYAQT